MPIYSAQNIKIIALNEDKTRGVSLEFPPDMKTGELLDKVNEIKDQVEKALEEQLKKGKDSKDAEKKNDKKEEKIEDAKVEIIKETK